MKRTVGDGESEKNNEEEEEHLEKDEEDRSEWTKDLVRALVAGQPMQGFTVKNEVEAKSVPLKALRGAGLTPSEQTALAAALRNGSSQTDQFLKQRVAANAQ